MIGCEGYAHVGELLDDPSLPVVPYLQPRLQLGRGASACDYPHLLREVGQRKRDRTQALGGCDALLTPTTLTGAPHVADIDQSGTAAVFTRAINLVGDYALALPNGFTPFWLPTSLQIAYPAFQEATALRIGWALEQRTVWHRRPPRLPYSSLRAARVTAVVTNTPDRSAAREAWSRGCMELEPTAISHGAETNSLFEQTRE